MRHLTTLLPMSVLVVVACSSSSGNGSPDTGTITGRVEQVFHHGAYDPNGPNATVTPMQDVTINIADTLGLSVDSTVSDSGGKFSVTLAPGEYVVSIPENGDEDVPGSSTGPTRVRVLPGQTATVVLQYNVFAP